MAKEPKFLLCQGDVAPDGRFLLAYSRCILLALEGEGVLDREQRERCMDLLKKQYQ